MARLSPLCVGPTWDCCKVSNTDTDTGWQFSGSIFMRKRQNGECNVRDFRRCLFDMSSDVRAFKTPVFASDFEFWVGVNVY